MLAPGHFLPPSAMLGGDRFCFLTGRRFATAARALGHAGRSHQQGE